jgi:hypothetical protein
VRRLLARRELHLPNRIDATGEPGREAMPPRANTDLYRAVRGVRVPDHLTGRRSAFVLDDGAGGIGLEHQLRHARFERREVALKLRALIGVHALTAFGQVLLERRDGLTVALELHGTDAQVAQDLP